MPGAYTDHMKSTPLIWLSLLCLPGCIQTVPVIRVSQTIGTPEELRKAIRQADKKDVYGLSRGVFRFTDFLYVAGSADTLSAWFCWIRQMHLPGDGRRWETTSTYRSLTRLDFDWSLYHSAGSGTADQVTVFRVSNNDRAARIWDAFIAKAIPEAKYASVAAPDSVKASCGERPGSASGQEQ